MAKGFYHHERGYWETSGPVPQSILVTYPEGTVEVSLKPVRSGYRYEWNGVGWTEIAGEVSEPTADDVIAERERRLAAGFDYDFGDERGVHRIATTKADMEGWDEVAKLAAALVAVGDTTTLISIMTETGAAQITSLEWSQIALAAAQFRQPIWAASFALQAMDPIPGDYDDDGYWS